MIIPVAVLVVVLLFVGWLVRAGWKRARLDEDRHRILEVGALPTLEYVVPDGQDPIVVIAALKHAGLETTRDSDAGEQRLLIACTEGVSRERVRAAIETADRTAIQDGAPMHRQVRFADEP